MAKQLQVVIDCADPGQLAQFWCEAAGYIIQPPPEGFENWEDALRSFGVPEDQWDSASAAVDPEGVGPRLFFQKVPEHKVVKNRLHLDIAQGTREMPLEERRSRVEAEVTRLSGFGASEVQRFERPDEFFVVMQDPEGNEFCLH